MVKSLLQAWARSSTLSQLGKDELGRNFICVDTATYHATVPLTTCRIEPIKYNWGAKTMAARVRYDMTWSDNLEMRNLLTSLIMITTTAGGSRTSYLIVIPIPAVYNLALANQIHVGWLSATQLTPSRQHESITVMVRFTWVSDVQ